MDMGRANDQRKTAVCILGQDSASLSVIDTPSGAIEVATTTASRDCVALSVWLNSAFGLYGSQPEALYLIGSRSQLAAIAGPLDDSLPIPVVATHDAQLALARGAAASNTRHLDHVAAVNGSGFASQARTLTVVAAVAVVSLFTLSSAGSPITMAEKSVAQPAPAPPPAAQPAEIPPTAAPVAPPVMLPPAPAAVAEPMTAELPQGIDPRTGSGHPRSRCAPGRPFSGAGDRRRRAAGGASSRPAASRAHPRGAARGGAWPSRSRAGSTGTAGSPCRGAEPPVRAVS